LTRFAGSLRDVRRWMGACSLFYGMAFRAWLPCLRLPVAAVSYSFNFLTSWAIYGCKSTPCSVRGEKASIHSQVTMLAPRTTPPTLCRPRAVPAPPPVTPPAALSPGKMVSIPRWDPMGLRVKTPPIVITGGPSGSQWRGLPGRGGSWRGQEVLGKSPGASSTTAHSVHVPRGGGGCPTLNQPF
jgi:hypothetical protein